MKRIVKWLIAIIVLVVILALIITPYFIGGHLKNEVQKSVKATNKRLGYQGVKLEDYQRHWWTSNFTLKFSNSSSPNDLTAASIKKIKLTVHHGPIAIASSPVLPHTIYFGYGSVTGQAILSAASKKHIKGFDKPVPVGALLSWGEKMRLFAKTPDYTVTFQKMKLHIGSVSFIIRAPLDTFKQNTDNANERTKWQVTFDKSYLKSPSNNLSKGYPKQITLNRIVWQNSFKGNPMKDWHSITHLTIPKITVSFKGLPDAVAHNLSYRFKSQAKSNMINVLQRLKVKNIKALGAKVAPIELNVSWKDIDQKALNKLHKLLKQERAEQVNNDEVDEAQETKEDKQVMDYFSELASGSHGHLKLKGKTPLGWINLKAHGKFASGQSMQFTLHSLLQLPKAFLSAQKAQQDALTSLLHVGASMAYQQNWLEKQDDHLQAQLAWKEGQVTLNGEPLQNYWSSQEDNQQLDNNGSNSASSQAKIMTTTS